jgi:hypothetical protein
LLFSFKKDAAGVDAVNYRTTSCPCWESNPDSLLIEPTDQSQHCLSYKVKLCVYAAHHETDAPLFTNAN